MSRAVICRAWNKKTNSYVKEGDLVLDLRSGNICAGDLSHDESTIDITDSVELEHAIGREDNCDNKIFENDIVRIMIDGYVFGYYQETEYLGIVKYDVDLCTYYVDLVKSPVISGEEIPDMVDGIKIEQTDPDGENNNRFYFDETVTYDVIETLGNTRENPELLEIEVAE